MNGSVVPLQAHLKNESPTGGGGSQTIGPPPAGPSEPLSERLSRVEGIIQGLQHSHSQMFVSIVLVATTMIGLSIYILTKIDGLTDRMNALPGAISSDLRDITKTLAESITAAKQQPPQVILMPAPVTPPPAPATKP